MRLNTVINQIFLWEEKGFECMTFYFDVGNENPNVSSIIWFSNTAGPSRRVCACVCVSSTPLEYNTNRKQKSTTTLNAPDSFCNHLPFVYLFILILLSAENLCHVKGPQGSLVKHSEEKNVASVSRILYKLQRIKLMLLPLHFSFICVYNVFVSRDWSYFMTHMLTFVFHC